MRFAGILLILLSSSLGTAQAADDEPCKLSPNKRWVTMVVSNPLALEVDLTVTCYFPLPDGGMTSVSCTKKVPAGAKNFELCTRTSWDNPSDRVTR